MDGFADALLAMLCLSGWFDAELGDRALKNRPVLFFRLRRHQNKTPIIARATIPKTTLRIMPSFLSLPPLLSILPSLNPVAVDDFVLD